MLVVTNSTSISDKPSGTSGWRVWGAATQQLCPLGFDFEFQVHQHTQPPPKAKWAMGASQLLNTITDATTTDGLRLHRNWIALEGRGDNSVLVPIKPICSAIFTHSPYRYRPPVLSYNYHYTSCMYDLTYIRIKIWVLLFLAIYKAWGATMTAWSPFFFILYTHYSCHPNRETMMSAPAESQAKYNPSALWRFPGPGREL